MVPVAYDAYPHNRVSLLFVVVNELVDDLVDCFPGSLDPGSHRASGVEDDGKLEDSVITGHVGAGLPEWYERLGGLALQILLDLLAFVARILVLRVDDIDLKLFLQVGEAFILGIDDRRGASGAPINDGAKTFHAAQ